MGQRETNLKNRPTSGQKNSGQKNSGSKNSRPTTGDPLLRQAIESLVSAARWRTEKHPQGHLIQGHRQRLELTLPIPLGPGDGALDDAVREAEEDLAAEIEALFLQRATFLPGRLFCLRCGSAECEHSAPTDARHVFVGYGPSGLPQFADFAQWLLERQHDRLDRIYQRPPGLVTEIVSGQELSQDLLEVFHDSERDFRVHGQLVAGWFQVPRANGGPALLALSFQVLSTTDRRRKRKKSGGRRSMRRSSPKPRRRLTLSVVGRGPDGEPLQELYTRLGQLPWQSVVAWGQQVLETIENGQGQKKATPELMSKRIEGMLQSMARRLEQGRRSRDRRTDHAEKRHHEGDRPTRMAHADLSRAADDQFYFDRRRKTLIVLGERGRAHVFNPKGKLVTSIRYSPDSIGRKVGKEIWRPATGEEVMGLRKNVGAGAS